jgi:hypothetical protein
VLIVAHTNCKNNKQILSFSSELPVFVPLRNCFVVAEHEDDSHGHADGVKYSIDQRNVKKFSNFFPLEVNERFGQWVSDQVIPISFGHPNR